MWKSIAGILGVVVMSLPLALKPVPAAAESIAAGSVTVATMSLTNVALTASAEAGGGALGADHPSALPAGSVILTVAGVEMVASGAEIVLEGVADGSAFTLTAAGTVVRDGLLVVGQTIEAVFVGVGHVLTSDGRTIAFVPNAAAEPLLYSAKLTR